MPAQSKKILKPMADQTVASMLRKFQAINRNPVQLIADQVEQEEATRSTLRILNREQLLQGKDATGAKLRPAYRSPSYARRKNQQNSAPGEGTPDLFLTGDFSRSIFAEVQGDKVIFDATDEKTPALAAKYGEAIFGLTPENDGKYSQIIIPRVVQSIRDKTGVQ